MKLLFLFCFLGVLACVSLVRATGACNNTADLATFQSHWNTFRSDLQKCGLKCVTRNPCTSDCLAEKTGVSKPCAVCFGQSVSCVRDNCYWSCLNPNSQKCAKCSIKNCAPTLQDCTGCTRDKEDGHCQLPPY